MTVFYSFRLLINGLRDGRIPITDALTRICNDRGIRGNTRGYLDQVNAFSDGFPSWLKALLAEEGLSQEEIDHADSWPADQKEALRAELAFAYDAGVDITFGWDITRSELPETTIQKKADGSTHVVLLSPRVMLEEGLQQAPVS